jgi:hypothetical protein
MNPGDPGREPGSETIVTLIADCEGGGGGGVDVWCCSAPNCNAACDVGGGGK